MAAVPQTGSAREFFVSRIASQAANEGAPLTESEIRYLEWRRIEDPEEQERLHAIIEQTYGGSGFEQRMTGLLWRGMDSDTATDARALQRYRESYDQLDGAEKDCELWVIATPVINPPQPAFTRGLLLLVGLFGLAFTLIMILTIIRYLFWK